MPAAWTTPRNWTAGELVTAAIGNSAWRDNFMYLKDSPVFDGNVTVTGTTLLTGVATLTAAPVFSSATASQAVFTNGSKALVSNAITGTGNVVMSASPTLTGTIAGAAMTLSSTLGVTGATTLSSTVATGALTVTGAATVSTTLGVTGLITSTGGITGGASSHTTGAFSSTVTGGTYNGQTISSAASFTGTLATVGAITAGGTIQTLGTLQSSSSADLTLNANGVNRDVYIKVNGTTLLSAIGSTGGVTVAGLLTVSGAGTNTFSAGSNAMQSLDLTNTTSGTAARSYFGVNAGTTSFYVQAFSQGYTTVGNNIASSALLESTGTAGLSISASNASGTIRFYSGGSTKRWTIGNSGELFSGTVTAGSDFLNFQLGTGSDSNLLVGVSTTSSVYQIRFYNANGPIGSISTSGSVTAFNTSSDARLKRSLGIALHTDVLSKTVIRDFEWLTNGVKSRGAFAQEAYAVAPFAVMVGSDEMKDGHLVKPWAVDYSKYVPDLIVGWQQHDATITQLAARIAALETKDN